MLTDIKADDITMWHYRLGWFTIEGAITTQIRVATDPEVLKQFNIYSDRKIAGGKWRLLKKLQAD